MADLTPEQWASDIVVQTFGADLIGLRHVAEIVRDIQNAAVEAEREACAKLCDEFGASARVSSARHTGDGDEHRARLASRSASAFYRAAESIRARGQEANRG